MFSQNVLIHDAAEQLRNSLRNGLTIGAGKIKIVSLTNIRAGFGEAWPRTEKTIYEKSLAFLRGCLPETDLVLPMGDGFVIVSSTDAGRDLAAESRQLQSTLEAFFAPSHDVPARPSN